MMLVGVGAIALTWAAVSPVPGLIPSPDLRRLLTGIRWRSPNGDRTMGDAEPTECLAGGRVMSTELLHETFQGLLTPVRQMQSQCQSFSKERRAFFFRARLSKFLTLGSRDEYNPLNSFDGIVHAIPKLRQTCKAFGCVIGKPELI